MITNKTTARMVTEKGMKNIIENAGYRIVDRVIWNKEVLKQTNRHNTEIIKKNVERLISLYPDKKEMFNEYLQNQIDECEELENDYTCTTLLLRQRNSCA